jgi:hypothetical protein
MAEYQVSYVLNLDLSLDEMKSRGWLNIHTATLYEQIQGVIDAIPQIHSAGGVGVAAPCL